MSQTFKLIAGSAADAVSNIDLPVSGRIKSILWSIHLTAGAGGVGVIHAELSRAPVNQIATNNPRGVVSQAVAVTQAASTGIRVNYTHCGLDEPVRQGERLYLNTGGASANVGTVIVSCLLTLS